MEILEKIIDLLTKLQFSFWQIVIVFIIVIFRKELIYLIHRIQKVKIGENEVNLNAISETVKNIDRLNMSLEKEKNAKIEKKVIQNKLRDLTDQIYINALINIKNKTRFLWPEILNAIKEKKTIINTKIREDTVNKIIEDINLLSQNNLFTYTYKHIYNTIDDESVFEITLSKFDKKFYDLVGRVPL